MTRWSPVAASISTCAICVALSSCGTASVSAPTTPAVVVGYKPTGTVALWGSCGPTSYATNLEPIFQVMQQRGLTQYRVQINLTADTDSYEVGMLQGMVSLGAKYGVVIKPILFTAFAFGDATDKRLVPSRE